MTLNMLMDSVSTPLFRIISPWLTLRSRDRESALKARERQPKPDGTPSGFFFAWCAGHSATPPRLRALGRRRISDVALQQKRSDTMVTPLSPLALPPRLVACWAAQLRSCQSFVRSQCFYTGRVLLGPAPWPDKLGRVGRRQYSDTLALAYDCTDAGCRLQHAALASLAGVGLPDDWLAIWLRFDERCRLALLAGYLAGARATLH